MRPQPFVCVWLPEHLGWALGLNRTLVVQSCCKMSTIVTVCSEALLIIYSNIVRKGKWIFVMTLYNICNICILNHNIFDKDWISSFRSHPYRRTILYWRKVRRIIMTWPPPWSVRPNHLYASGHLNTWGEHRGSITR